MKTVAVVLVVMASALGWSAPTVALPPEDVASYCRATYPQVPFQIRCMSLERASQDRAAAARSAIDPATWNRCQSGSASWSAMEACLAQPATASSPAPGGSVVPPAAGASEPADEQARRQPADGGAPAAGAPGPARRLWRSQKHARSAGGTARPRDSVGLAIHDHPRSSAEPGALSAAGKSADAPHQRSRSRPAAAEHPRADGRDLGPMHQAPVRPGLGDRLRN